MIDSSCGVSDDELLMDLAIAIEAIEKGKRFNKRNLKMLFAPTGPIQEIAIDEGWGDRYLELAALFDQEIG
jgi:hypothetical protein